MRFPLGSEVWALFESGFVLIVKGLKGAVMDLYIGVFCPVSSGGASGGAGGGAQTRAPKTPELTGVKSTARAYGEEGFPKVPSLLKVSGSESHTSRSVC